MPTSQDFLVKSNARLKFRVRMWKNLSGVQLSPVKSCSYTKLALTAPAWIKEVRIKFGTIPYFYRLEVSDYGAYSILAQLCSVGSSSCVVADGTGFEPGRKCILKSNNGNTDKLTILSVTPVVGQEPKATIAFSGQTTLEHGATYTTAEDDRWYQFAKGYTGDLVTTTVFGGFTDDIPMIGIIGQYIKVASESVPFLSTSTFDIYEEDYFDVTEYLDAPIEVRQSVDIVKGSSPLASASVPLVNRDDRFNRRNASSPYIEGGINYLELPIRMTIEWLGCGSNWEEGVNASNATDWQLLCSYTSRRPSLTRGEHSIATFIGETLNRLSTPIDIPLLEVKGVSDLMKNVIVMEDYRSDLTLTLDAPTEYPIAVIEDDAMERTNTSFNEMIGRGTFGVAEELYYDAGEKAESEGGTSLLYGGYYGLASDNLFIYTTHSIETDDNGNPNRGVVIVQRYMNTMPTGDVHWIFEADAADVDAGDLCITGDYMWIHTCQIGVTNNVFKIPMTGANAWTVTGTYSKKGGIGHIPVHAVSATDTDYMYVLYDGGSEGRILYKVNVSDYSTVWSHTFSSADNTRIDYGVAGMVLIGSAKLFIFSKAEGDPDRTNGYYYAVIFTLADTPAYATYSHTLPMDSRRGLYHDVALDNTYGFASVILTNAGLIALIGPNAAFNPDPKSGSYRTAVLWTNRTAVFTSVGQVKYYLQNGRVINNRDEYIDPKAEKDAANFDLELILIDGEIQDNGLDPQTGTFTATYSGNIKTTADYQINLLTGEILFISPPYMGAIVRVHYDYKPGVQYISQNQVERWETMRQLAEAAGTVVITTAQERVGYKLRRKQEDHIFPVGTADTYQLAGRNIIHPSNPAYSQNTIQVANAEHNYYYVQGTDYNIAYDAVSGVYTMTEVLTQLENVHVVITYLTGPTDDSLPIFDNEGKVRPADILDLSEGWDLSQTYNMIVVSGERAYPTDSPMTIIETMAVAPRTLNVDYQFVKAQKATPLSQYRWDAEKKIFAYETDSDQSAPGFVVKFQEPLIVGTTQWRLREPDTSKVETDTGNYPGPQPAWWIKFTWGTAFLEPGSSEETTDYDVIVDNPLFWRVAVPGDVTEIRAQTGSSDEYKTGSYIYIKKFRDGGTPSDDCIAYAYQLQDSYFYIDEAGRVQSGILGEASNPNPSASPDKKMDIRIEPTNASGAHLFRAPGTYDGVVIGEDHCLNVGAVRITHDGVSADVYNYSTEANYLRVQVTGYPLANIEQIRVKSEDRIRLDATRSTIEIQGQRPLNVENPYCQSQGTGRTIGFILLDWCKSVHTVVPLRSKFRANIGLLDPCLITSDYGNFDDTAELWLTVGIIHSIQKGYANMSTTDFVLMDIPDNPSAPPPAS